LVVIGGFEPPTSAL